MSGDVSQCRAALCSNGRDHLTPSSFLLLLLLRHHTSSSSSASSSFPLLVSSPLSSSCSLHPSLSHSSSTFPPPLFPPSFLSSHFPPLFSPPQVMSGSGDLEVLRVIRRLHARVTCPEVTYGNHMASHMALGLLFLGGCRWVMIINSCIVHCPCCILLLCGLPSSPPPLHAPLCSPTHPPLFLPLLFSSPFHSFLGLIFFPPNFSSFSHLLKLFPSSSHSPASFPPPPLPRLTSLPLPVPPQLLPESQQPGHRLSLCLPLPPLPLLLHRLSLPPSGPASPLRPRCRAEGTRHTGRRNRSGEVCKGVRSRKRGDEGADSLYCTRVGVNL